MDSEVTFANLAKDYSVLNIPLFKLHVLILAFG